MIISTASIASIRRAHQHIIAETQRAEREALEFAGRFAVDHVQRYPEFRPRTGALQRATKFKVVRGKTLRIYNDKKYAAAIDRGARPHIIRPRRSSVLRFRGRDGRIVFARRVNHPGNRPYRFLYRATNAAFRVFQRNLEQRLTAIASRFSKGQS